jgi:hypothetical protein
MVDLALEAMKEKMTTKKRREEPQKWRHRKLVLWMKAWEVNQGGTLKK